MLKALTALVLVAMLAPIKALYANEQPPQGSKDASCLYADNSPEFCKLKIDFARKKISIWYPANRESARTTTYSGKCLKKGCTLIGPDLGYPTREKIRIKSISNTYISWKSLDTGETQSVRITEYN